MDSKTKSTIFDTHLKNATSQNGFLVAIREPCKGGARFVDIDGNPARSELIAKYYAGEYGVINEAPDVPRQNWE